MLQLVCTTVTLWTTIGSLSEFQWNPIPQLSAVLLPQQGFDVAMDQHGDIDLDPSRPL
jgi:hypothetical protein